ncbi:MAG: FAD:protein FMN transferase, partial [Armatimonadetes bacterium]|nr:FAD:protein FMN transferase [Armatimonadota bacterium]
MSYEIPAPTGRLLIRTRRAAMGCEFELVLRGDDRDYLVNAAEEAFEEVKRLEEQLSVFIPTSEVSYINALAGSEPVRVEPRLFRLLQTASRISRETEGAFDITAGALIGLWKSAADIPSAEQLETALESTGMDKVILDEAQTTVRFANPGVKLDLGAIGKGYAAREVVEFLMERGITGALVSAGTSTVYALGAPP